VGVSGGKCPHSMPVKRIFSRHSLHRGAFGVAKKPPPHSPRGRAGRPPTGKRNFPNHAGFCGKLAFVDYMRKTEPVFPFYLCACAGSVLSKCGKFSARFWGGMCILKLYAFGPERANFGV